MGFKYGAIKNNKPKGNNNMAKNCISKQVKISKLEITLGLSKDGIKENYGSNQLFNAGHTLSTLRAKMIMIK